MKRRKLIAGLGAVGVIWSTGAQAQPDNRARRIGMLFGSSENDSNVQTWSAALRGGLEVLGWKEGGNIRYEPRYAAGDGSRAQQLAKELVALGPDVIVAANMPGALALLRETPTIPIVFTNISDPLASGLVASLARPGRNATGFTSFEFGIGGKWLEVLRDLSPTIRRTALVFNPATAPYASGYIRSIEQAARSFAVSPLVTPIADEGAIEALFAVEAREPGGSAIIIPDIFTVTHRRSVIAAAARHRVPTVYPFRIMAADGGLAVYGPDITDLFRRAAAYVDRVLKGARPSDLPVQQPDRFELVINLKTATALGLAVPPTLLARANEVIE